jgi:diguanylate cyclase (GGDEF)-like protein
MQVRAYFREQDWVARSAGDSFVVILPETPPADAEALADRVRKMIEDRLELRDHRSDAQVPVTVSVGVVVVNSADKVLKAEHLLARGKEAVERAKQAGRNRVERVDIEADRSASPPRERLSMD